MARPGSSPAGSPPTRAVRSRKCARSIAARPAAPSGALRSRTAEAFTRVASPTGPFPGPTRAASSNSVATGMRPPGSVSMTRTGADTGTSPTLSAVASNHTPPVASGRGPLSTRTATEVTARRSAAARRGSGWSPGADTTTEVTASTAPAAATSMPPSTARPRHHRSWRSRPAPMRSSSHAAAQAAPPHSSTGPTGSNPADHAPAQLATVTGSRRTSAARTALTVPPDRGRPRGSSRRSRAPRATGRRR